jgi:hypothetical protein
MRPRSRVCFVSKEKATGFLVERVLERKCKESWHCTTLWVRLAFGKQKLFYVMAWRCGV